MYLSMGAGCSPVTTGNIFFLDYYRSRQKVKVVVQVHFTTNPVLLSAVANAFSLIAKSDFASYVPFFIKPNVVGPW